MAPTVSSGGDSSYRAVTILQHAIEVLREQKRKTNDRYAFPSSNGGPISPDSVNNTLKRVLERAGIPKVRFHDLHPCHHLSAEGSRTNFIEYPEYIRISIEKP